MDSYTMPAYENMMQVNMATPLALILQFLPMLKLQAKSYILNIASSAVYQAVPGLGVYAASKSFVFSFSRSLRFELRDSNVSVTVVNPGTTDTDFANRAQVTNERALKAAAKLNMTPTAVAKIAVDGMYAGKAEVIPGLINKLGAFLTVILPKKVLEGGAAGIYGV
jgi:short-subunit dehydrogenase